MILDVPTSDELTQAGTNLLDLAWATDQPYRQINSSNEDSKLARASGPAGYAPRNALALNDAITVLELKLFIMITLDS